VKLIIPKSKAIGNGLLLVDELLYEDYDATLVFGIA
jgi:hypothetical protein